MYSFKLCLASSIGSPEMRRVSGSALEISTYAKFVNLCQSIYPKVIQSRKKVLIKYVDGEKDEVIADSEESFQGIHVYCRAMVQCNIQFCLRLQIDFMGDDTNAPPQCDSPVDDDHFVKIESPIAAENKTADQVKAAAPAKSSSYNAVATVLIPLTASTTSATATATATAIVESSKQETLPSAATASATATATAIVESSKQETLPSAATASTASATATATAIVESLKQETLPSVATASTASAIGSTAGATIKETRCRTCGVPTGKKCGACKSEHFCSTGCTKRAVQLLHTPSECRNHCIKNWKESGLVLPPPISCTGPTVETGLPIGTLVSAKFNSIWTYYDGFIASFDAATKVYAVKYDDGDFLSDVYTSEIKLRKPQLKSAGVWDAIAQKLTPQATVIIKEIFQRYSENGVVEIHAKDLQVIKQEMRFMSLTNFKLFISDFHPFRNEGVNNRVVKFYYKCVTGVASNDVPALLEEEFIKYYSEQAKMGNDSVWYDIFTMGYDATLQSVQNINIIRKGEVVLYRKSVECDFEEAVVLNVSVQQEPSTEFHIMLLKSGTELKLPKCRQTIRKYYNKCHKCRAQLKQVSLHSFCCCVNCEEPRADGSAIQSISI